jgi:hypothetical protein
MVMSQQRDEARENASCEQDPEQLCKNPRARGAELLFRLYVEDRTFRSPSDKANYTTSGIRRV